MSGTNFIPSTDSDFDIWGKNLMDCVIANATRFRFPEEEIPEFKEQYVDWHNKYETFKNPATATKAATLEKNEARKVLETKIRAINREYLAYNHLVTDTDRTNMQLPIHKTTHTPVPPPTTFPEFKIDTSTMRQVTIHFHDAGSTSKAKPPGVHGVEIAWAILETAPGSINDLAHSAFDTHTPYTFSFDEPDRGKSIYVCLRWENSKGDKGPWGSIEKAIIP